MKVVDVQPTARRYPRIEIKSLKGRRRLRVLARSRPEAPPHQLDRGWNFAPNRALTVVDLHPVDAVGVYNREVLDVVNRTEWAFFAWPVHKLNADA